MQNKNRIIVFLVLAVTLSSASSLYGQIIYGQPTSGGVQFIYSHWNIDDGTETNNIDQFMIPVSLFLPIKDNLEARFYIANSTNVLSYSGNDSTLSGMSDFRVQVNHSFSDDRFLISAGFNLPTGKKKLNRDVERTIIELLSENYLNFPMRSFGEGPGFNLLIGGATIVSSIRLGAGITWQYNGSYKPYENEGDYKPGDFVSISARADMGNKTSVLSTDVIYTFYSPDKVDGDKAFKQSPNLDLRLGAGLNGKAISLGTYISYLIRGQHTKYNIQSGDIFEQLKLYGNEFSINTAISFRTGEKYYIAPSVEMRLIEQNEKDIGNSSIFGFGGSFGKRTGHGIDYDIGAKYFAGKANGDEIDLKGLQFTVGLKALF